MIPVLLSGGSGTQLWPLSREAFPKQFAPLIGSESLLQSTWRRVEPLASAAPVVVAKEEHRFLVAEQLRQVGCKPQALLLEPANRDTAAAIAVAALQAQVEHGDPLLLVLPTDQLISNQTAFRDAAGRASSAADSGKIVFFGATPVGPATSCCYIQAAGSPFDERGENGGIDIRAVEGFVERPDLATAIKLVGSGVCSWGTGMLLSRTSVLLGELERIRPEILSACRSALATAKRDADYVWLGRDSFAKCPMESIEHALMERTDRAVVLRIDAGWNDIDTWSAVWSATRRDENGNSLRGDVETEESRNSLVWANDRLVVLLGLEDILVVDTADAILVAKQGFTESVEGIAARLKAADRPEAVFHRKLRRPWGTCQEIHSAGGFQVNHVVVQPGASVSPGLHQNRAQHLIVVRGTGRVVHGEEVTLLSENQGMYIPPGTRQRLENPGRIPLELIEVQSCWPPEEGDISQLDDLD